MKKILHYLHGMPPVRSGGLVRYALDLAQAQKNMGYDVALLVPGAFISKSSGHSTKAACLKKTFWNDITLYRLVNTIPVTDGKAIDDVELLHTDLYNQDLELLVKKENYNIIHIHSIMGLPKQLLCLANELGIRTVFTTHDYYGICPKATLLNGKEMCANSDGTACSTCLGEIVRVKNYNNMQAWWYACIKNKPVIQWLEYSPSLINIKRILDFKNRKKYICTVCDEKLVDTTISAKYVDLQSFYREMFQYISIFHFNSSQSRDVYQTFLGALNGNVINVMCRDIADHRVKKQFSKTLRLGFVGRGTFKGFEILKDALEIIYNKGLTDFECQIYNNTKEKLPAYFRRFAPYNDSEKEKVFGRMDVLVLPSIWRETFSLTVLEAISYGVPVIISEYVGAKDIVTNDIGYIIDTTLETLVKTIENIYVNRYELAHKNRAILDLKIDLSYENHVKMVDSLLY